MIKEELLDIVADLNFWHSKQDTGIEREELSEVMDVVGIKDISLLILGVRRAGKTYLTRQILEKKIKQGVDEEQTLYVNFEDSKLEPYLNTNVLDDLYETYRNQINKNNLAYIVLDEIQNVEGWEKWVRMMLEKGENVKIIITGSGSKILTPKLASTLTGRKITYNLFPLSLKDFLEFKGEEKKYYNKKDRGSLLREYIKFGAFPLTVLSQKTTQKNYFLQEIYDDIVTKDIMFKYKIRNENVLKKVAYLTLNNFAKLTSIRKIRNLLKSAMKVNVSPSTVSNYLKYFENSFLFIFLPMFSHTIKDQMQYPKKTYCIDTGIINSVIPKFSQNIGRLYENVLAIGLKRRGKEIYYWRNKKGQEVDFLVKKGTDVKQLIQVCYNIGKEDTKKRELNALVEASKELKTNNLLVVTNDYKATEKYKNKEIKFIPLWDWLMD